MRKDPQSFQDLTLSDLQRAQRLLRKVYPDPIDPQFRIATPEGDFWLGVCARKSDGQSKPSRRRLLTALPRCLVFQYMIMAASRFRPAIGKCCPLCCSVSDFALATNAQGIFESM